MFGAFLEHHLFRTIVFYSVLEKWAIRGCGLDLHFLTHLSSEKWISSGTTNWSENTNRWQYITFGQHGFPNAVFYSVLEKHKKRKRGQYSVFFFFEQPRSRFTVPANVFKKRKKWKRRQYITFTHPCPYFAVPGSVLENRKKQKRGQYITFARPRSQFTVPGDVSQMCKKQKRRQYITFARPDIANVKIHTIKHQICFVIFGGDVGDDLGDPFSWVSKSTSISYFHDLVVVSESRSLLRSLIYMTWWRSACLAISSKSTAFPYLHDLVVVSESRSRLRSLIYMTWWWSASVEVDFVLLFTWLGGGQLVSKSTSFPYSHEKCSSY